PKIEETSPIEPDLARKLEGRYQAEKKAIDLVRRDGKLFMYPLQGGSRVELRSLGKDLITDDLLGYGQKIIVNGDELKIGKEIYKRVAARQPGPVPNKLRGLIGEYGPDHNILYIFEKDGKLHCLIEWVFLYPLEEVKENEYKFPDFGLYQGDKLIFKRDKKGRAIRVEAASVPFQRRKIPGETAKVFTIKPSRSMDELRKLALAAKPPEEKNPLFKKTDLVDVTKLDKTIKLDIRYATTDNFLETPFYTSARAFLQKPAAEA